MKARVHSALCALPPSTAILTDQGPREVVHRGHTCLLTEGQDDDGDVLGTLAFLVDELPSDSLLPLGHPTVILPTVLLTEVEDLQYEDTVALFGHLQLSFGFSVGKFAIEDRYSVGPHAGNERAVEGPGDGKVSVRNILGFQDAPELHRLTNRVQPLIRLQTNSEIFV